MKNYLSTWNECPYIPSLGVSWTRPDLLSDTFWAYHRYAPTLSLICPQCIVDMFSSCDPLLIVVFSFKSVHPVDSPILSREVIVACSVTPVFHISLLEPALKNTWTAENIKIESNKEYEVEWILKDKCINGWLSYLVKWKGYSTLENTWEPIVHLAGCHNKVKKYHQQKDQGHSRKKENSLFESD